MARFKREANAAAALNSPYVVTIFDYDVDQGVPFIAMECLHGESLADRLEREERLSPGDTLEILTQVGRGLTKAHAAGVFHRDLKPDNIFLLHPECEGDPLRAKLLDFGIAKTENDEISSRTDKTTTGMFLGSPRYASPEQAQDSGNIDLRTDVWSFGVVAFECIVGRPPFVGRTTGDLLVKICAGSIPVPSSLAPVPLGFDDWFAMACRREREYRFQSIAEAVQALATVVGEPGHSLAPPPSGEATTVAAEPSLLPAQMLTVRPKRPAGRPRVILTVGVGTVILVAGAIAWVTVSGAASEPKAASASAAHVANSTPLVATVAATPSNSAVAPVRDPVPAVSEASASPGSPGSPRPASTPGAVIRTKPPSFPNATPAPTPSRSPSTTPPLAAGREATDGGYFGIHGNGTGLR